MKILFVASECVPFVKTGGLGDVVGSLSRALAGQNHQIKVVLPLYQSVNAEEDKLKVIFSPFEVKMGNTTIWCQVLEKKVSKNLSFYFIEHHHFYFRDPIYDDGKNAYTDNGARFAFLSKAGLDLSLALGFKPDVAHCHDWQTALVAYYLKTWGAYGDFFQKTGSVLTIHNIGYQGQVDPGVSAFIGLNWMQLRDSEFEALGALNLLKGGVFYADKVTTVSPTYAKEILSEPGGCGLSPFLLRRKDDVVGILNGIDTEEWNPQTDAFLPANYSASKPAGKKICKQELQKHFLLEIDPEKPIFGFVGRMASQKGLDLLLGCVHEVLSWDLQIVILGSGDATLTNIFGDLPKWYPGKVGAYIGFQSYLAHLIEAGSDFFVMPSRYEPCGLNQLYSMLYGTLPIVRATGGLKDTVVKLNPETQEGNGFSFEDETPMALRDTMGWALYTWYNQPKLIKKMQKKAMSQDFGWDRAIPQYIEVYKGAVSRKKSWFGI